jgi:transketolase
VILLASGSEVSLALDAAKVLAGKGIAARVVSMPSWELFDRQSDDYKQSVLPFDAPKVVIEAAVQQGWHRYTGPVARFVTNERFGASAPYKEVFKHYGFTTERVVAEVEALLSEAN